MKKSSKPIIILLASFLLIITIILLISQGLRLKYEQLQRELTQLENQTKSEKTILVNLIANYQMMTAEDEIKKFAQNELGLIEADPDSIIKITISAEEIVKLSENLGTYE